MAGTVTESVDKLGPIHKVTLSVTADAAAATVPDTAIAHKVAGRILALETNPGATAPTANYDITLEDGAGHDVLEGVGANRHTSSTEKVHVIYSGTEIHPPIAFGDSLTFKLANNSENSATLTAALYIAVGG